MSKLMKMRKSAHVHIALATGTSIIVLAYVSKYLLPEPISYLQMAIPPSLMAIWEGLVNKNKHAKYSRTTYWVIAIVAATVVVIWMNLP
ncbi:MAG: hypothetical protein OEY63_03375 [Gemmatimonadota bacterium]|nr:hypothetical protein [Gemmatimonadota bacterium]MDH5804564.1 hypothetical protein [Gemmatimonadota bacterium]